MDNSTVVTWGTDTSEVVTWVLIGIVFCICCYLWVGARSDVKKGKINNNAQYSVSIGVLGTFVGILYGLHNFDLSGASAIEDSIKEFLNGMKLSFITSVIGMFFSLLIKGKQGTIEDKQTEDQENNLDNLKYLKGLSGLPAEIINMAIQFNSSINSMVEVKNSLAALTEVMQNSSNAGIAQSVEKLTNVIQEVKQTTQENNILTGRMAEVMENQNNQISSLRNVLVESGKQQLEYLLSMKDNISSMKNVSCEMFNQTVGFHNAMNQSSDRQEQILAENNQGLKDMRLSFDEFLKNMSENYSKAFIEALTQSIRQLNVELQEQLGGNFQKLNQAVTDLLDWQIHYKETVESTQKQLNTFLDSVQAFESQVGETMPGLLSQMDGRIQAMDGSVSRLGDTLISVDTSLEAFDQQMRTKLEAYLAGVENGLQEFSNNCNDILMTAASKIGSNLNQFEESWTENLDNSMTELQSVFTRFNTVLLAGVGQLNQKLCETVEGYKDELLHNMGNSFGNLNNGLQTELEQVCARFQSEMGQSFNRLHGTLEKGMEGFFDTLEEDLEEQHDKFVHEAGDRMDDHTRELANRMSRSLESFDNSMNITVQETMDALKNDFDEIGNKIAGAGEQQVRELGTALVAITNKMTENYQQLMDELARLHNILMRNGER